MLQEGIDAAEGLLAIVIVGIDHGKGLVQDRATGQQGLAGAPGLAPGAGKADALRQLLQTLVGIGDFHAQPGTDRLDPVPYDLTEVLFNVSADDKYDFAEAGLDGVMDRVINNQFAAGPYGLQLLDAAAVTRADACCQDNQRRFDSSSLLSVIP